MEAATVTDSTLVDVLCAAHLTCYVSTPFTARGGILLVAPPEQLKTSFVGVLERYRTFRMVSDMTVKGLDLMRDTIIAGQITTLAFAEMKKLYQRDDSVSSNIEGVLTAMMEEGFGLPNWKDQSMPVAKARCLMIGCLTNSMFEKHSEEWKDGLLRRVLISWYRLKDVNAVEDAIRRWKLFPVGHTLLPEEPPQRVIEPNLSESDRKAIEDVLTKYRKLPSGQATPYNLLCKIAIVLKWHYERNKITRDAIETIREFAHTFTPEPMSQVSLLQLEEVYRKEEENKARIAIDRTQRKVPRLHRRKHGGR